MAYNYGYGGYPGPGGYYAPPMPDQLAQLRGAPGQFQPPVMGQQQMLQNQPMQQMAQPVQQMNATNGNSMIIWVNGEKEVEDYLIAPNSAVALWDKNLPVVYLKQADATGKPTIDVYDLVKRQPVQSVQNKIIESQSATWATKDELNALSARVDSLLAVSQSQNAKTKKQTKDVEEQ